jgi:hypothetical protein
VTARAVLFDFNGTLSDDEPILCAIFQELFAEHGRPLSAQEYYDVLAGLSDPEIVKTWLGEDHPDVDAVIEERVSRYRDVVADGSSIGEPVREAVRYAAERVPVAIVSGAARAEIEPVVDAAGSLRCSAGSSRPTTSSTESRTLRGTCARSSCSTASLRPTSSSSRTRRRASPPRRRPACTASRASGRSLPSGSARPTS